MCVCVCVCVQTMHLCIHSFIGRRKEREIERLVIEIIGVGIEMIKWFGARITQIHQMGKRRGLLIMLYGFVREIVHYCIVL